jgi:sugar phosphate isomerase/epimerase
MSVLVTDWSSIEQVLPLARDFGVGLEFQEFIRPENLDKPDDILKIIYEGKKDLPDLSMHGPFVDLIPASQDPWVRQVVEKRFIQAYDVAQMSGSQHLILHSGFFPKTYSRDDWIRNASDFWVDFLKDKRNPGLIHVENVYEDDYSTLQGLIDRVNEAMHEEALTICLDIGHVNANSSKNIDEWISGLGDRIRYTHLHNNGGILDDHWRLDKGTIKIHQVLELLKKHSPQAAWCVETTVGDIEPSLKWLKREGYL